MQKFSTTSNTSVHLVPLSPISKLMLLYSVGPSFLKNISITRSGLTKSQTNIVSITTKRGEETT